MEMDKRRAEVDMSGTVLEAPAGLDPDCYLFLGDPEKKTLSEFQRYWMTGSACVAFGLGSMIANAAARIPMRAGFYKHIFWAVSGLVVGEGAFWAKQKYDIEKDLQYFHYMVLHPEDFQPPERKKYADTIQPWLPFR